MPLIPLPTPPGFVAQAKCPSCRCNYPAASTHVPDSPDCDLARETRLESLKES